jgi:predicted aspartyl protease
MTRAERRPFSICTSTYDALVERRTASRTEQRKDAPRAIETKRIRPPSVASVAAEAAPPAEVQASRGERAGSAGWMGASRSIEGGNAGSGGYSASLGEATAPGGRGLPWTLDRGGGRLTPPRSRRSGRGRKGRGAADAPPFADLAGGDPKHGDSKHGDSKHGDSKHGDSSDRECANRLRIPARLFILPALLLILLGGSGCVTVRSIPDGVELAAPIVELEVERVDGVLAVEAMIDGHGPYRLIIDTGASVLTLSPRVIDEVGLETRRLPWYLNGAMESQWGWCRSGVVSELRLGDRARIPTMRFVEHEIPSEADGLLGNGILEFCTLKIGPEHRRVWLASEASAPGPGDVPLRLADGVPTVEFTVGEETLRATLDTGCAGTLILPGEWEDRLPLAEGGSAVLSRSLHGPRTLTLRRLQSSVEVGDLVIERPFLSFGGGPMLLGLPLLRGHAVEVDMQSRVLRIGEAVSLPLQRR